MKRFCNVIIVAILVFLFIGYVNATGISMENNVTASIAEKELQLANFPLIINDSYDTTDAVIGLYVSDITTGSVTPQSQTITGKGQSVSSQLTGYAPNLVPNGGFIAYGSDGKTRVFTSGGVELSYSVNNQVEQITTPSGKTLPANHVIGIPSGATIHPRGNNEYITANGQVILTIVDQTSSGEPETPLPKGKTWVEYAESDPQSNLVNFSSSWVIPYSPDLADPNGSLPTATFTNLVWNGIEPSDGSSILQPVTAFDYRGHSEFSTNANAIDPFIVNNWTGASWYCGDVCFRSTPAITFTEGDVAQGRVYRIPSVSTWIIDLENDNTGEGSGLSLEDSNAPYRAVLVYEWGSNGPSSGILPRPTQEVSSTTFSDISASDSGNLPLTLNWNPYINQEDHTGTTGLYVNLAQLPSAITLCTDCTSYTITPSAGSGGSITPGSPVRVLAGGSQNFNIIPETGYSIANVVVDGASQGAIPSYTFTNVQQDSTISATFVRSGWNWSTDGWGDWQHTWSVSGQQTGSNVEYGPNIANGVGVHGTSTHLSAGSTQSSVSKTFTDSTGNGWNTLTFVGSLTSSSVPNGRWMSITVNGQQVFGATALQNPPCNTGQPFTITATFPQTTNAAVTISQGQNPAWGVNFLMNFNSLTFSKSNTLQGSSTGVQASSAHAAFTIPDGSEWKGNVTASNVSESMAGNTS